MKIACVTVALLACACGDASSQLDGCLPATPSAVWQAPARVHFAADPALLDEAGAAVAAWRPFAHLVGVDLSVSLDDGSPAQGSIGFTAPDAATMEAGEADLSFARVGGVRHITRADILMNPTKRHDPVSVLVHEMGHALGLMHDADPSTAMFCYVTGFHSPQDGDERALLSAYQ